MIAFLCAFCRPATAAEVIASCEDYDADLAELFRRNEQGLRDIRKDLAEIRGDAQTNVTKSDDGRIVE